MTAQKNSKTVPILVTAVAILATLMHFVGASLLGNVLLGLNFLAVAIYAGLNFPALRNASLAVRAMLVFGAVLMVAGTCLTAAHAGEKVERFGTHVQVMMWELPGHRWVEMRALDEVGEEALGDAPASFLYYSVDTEEITISEFGFDVLVPAEATFIPGAQFEIDSSMGWVEKQTYQDTFVCSESCESIRRQSAGYQYAYQQGYDHFLQIAGAAIAGTGTAILAWTVNFATKTVTTSGGVTYKVLALGSGVINTNVVLGAGVLIGGGLVVYGFHLILQAREAGKVAAEAWAQDPANGCSQCTTIHFGWYVTQSGNNCRNPVCDEEEDAPGSDPNDGGGDTGGSSGPVGGGDGVATSGTSGSGGSSYTTGSTSCPDGQLTEGSGLECGDWGCEDATEDTSCEACVESRGIVWVDCVTPVVVDYEPEDTEEAD